MLRCQRLVAEPSCFQIFLLPFTIHSHQTNLDPPRNNYGWWATKANVWLEGKRSKDGCKQWFYNLYLEQWTFLLSVLSFRFWHFRNTSTRTIFVHGISFSFKMCEKCFRWQRGAHKAEKSNFRFQQLGVRLRNRVPGEAPEFHQLLRPEAHFRLLRISLPS